MSTEAWRGTPWGPVDDPGELASMAADERAEAAAAAASASVASIEARKPEATLLELTDELRELRIRIEYADDQAAVELAQRISAVLLEVVALTQVAA